MRILGVYLSRVFIQNFVLGLLLLVVVFVLQEMLRQLMGDPFPAGQIIVYNLWTVPEVAVNLSPPAVMVGTLLTLTQLSRSGELVALYSIGWSQPRLISLIISWALVICCLLLVVQDRVLPPVFRAKTTHYWRKMKGKSDFFLDAKQSKIWYRSQNLIYNLDIFDPQKKTIFGLSIYTFDQDFSLVQVLQAQRAVHHAPPQGPSPEKSETFWTLYDGRVTVFDRIPEVGDMVPNTRNFKEKELRILETPDDFAEIEREVDGLSIAELSRYIRKARATGADTRVYESKLQFRFSLSVIPLVMCLLALPFGMKSRRESGLAKDIGLCMAVTFFYWLAMTIGLSVGKNGTVAPWVGAWGPTLLFLGVALLLLLKKK